MVESFNLWLVEPDSIAVGVLAEPGDLSIHNYIDPSSDFYDDKDSNPKFGIMKRLTPGTIVGPVDEGSKIRLVCRAGRARPIPQVTWWQHNRGPIDDDDLGNISESNDKILKNHVFICLLYFFSTYTQLIISIAEWIPIRPMIITRTRGYTLHKVFSPLWEREVPTVGTNVVWKQWLIHCL